MSNFILNFLSIHDLWEVLVTPANDFQVESGIEIISKKALKIEPPDKYLESTTAEHPAKPGYPACSGRSLVGHLSSYRRQLHYDHEVQSAKADADAR